MNEIRDPIYGFINLDDSFLKVVNTGIFQRMRRIRQLAMAYLVYPGANHTRFDHSLGVYHVATIMTNKLLKSSDEDERRYIRLAALLHDIGHGPFSHVSEDILDKYSDENNGNKDKIHEKITRNLILKNKELSDIISKDDRYKISGLLNGDEKNCSLNKEMISGPLDADKIDYLLRDSYFCGVKYGVFDLERFLNTLTAFEDQDDKMLAVNIDGINTLEQYVMAKYYMIEQVYTHKVRKISDAMIKRGIELGIEKDNIEFLSKIYKYKEDEKYLENYLEYWDEKIVDKIVFEECYKKTKAHRIFEKLYSRRLFKRIYTVALSDENIKISAGLKDKLININSKENAELKLNIEKNVAKIVKCDSDDVIVNVYETKSVKEMSRNRSMPITIIDGNGKKRNFEEMSFIFSSIEKGLKKIQLEIYAECVYDTSKEKNKKKIGFKGEIEEMLKQEAKDED